MQKLSKPINKITLVRAEHSKKFIEEFNKNKVSEEFLESCKKAGELFGKKKR